MTKLFAVVAASSLLLTGCSPAIGPEEVATGEPSVQSLYQAPEEMDVLVQKALDAT